MGTDPGATIARRVEGGPLDRLSRCVLVAYLSPVILIVLAIGLVGMLAAKVGRPTGRAAIDRDGIPIEGVHPAHGPGRPMGPVKESTRVRELA